MNTVLCKVEDEDAKILTDSVVEVNTCQSLYEKAIARVDIAPQALKAIIDYLVYSKQVHRETWWNTLVKYVGQEKASLCFGTLRFDIAKKVIFQINSEGCAVCKMK